MSNNMIHPARTIPFDELYSRLQDAVATGRIYERSLGDLRLYAYTDETVYSRDWDEITLMARGLVIDVVTKSIVATPFPKFFNVGEVEAGNIPDLPFETFEKMDGSLIINYYHNGAWHCATKGSLESDQAKWAEKWIAQGGYDLDILIPRYTYLAEAIYPQNRIVVNYGGNEELVLLASYREDGTEVPTEELAFVAETLGWRLVPRYSYESISELLEKAKKLTCNEEGYVLRFSNGLRLKIKGDEYCRVHRLVSNLTPLSVWRQIRDEEDLELTRRSLPEEFWEDFDAIKNLLESQLNSLLLEVSIAVKEVSNLSDKEVGLRLDKFAPHIRRFIFPARKGTLLYGRRRIGLFETIRPHRNILEGYRPSSSITRIQGEGE